jgi:two-component system cell cycle response regulator
MIEPEIRDYVEGALGFDLYLLLVLDKRRRRISSINKNIPPVLEEEISRASLSHDFSGPFEQGSLSLEGKSLFDFDELAGSLIAKKERLIELEAEELSWIKLMAIKLAIEDKEQELEIWIEKLALVENSINLFNYDYFRKQLEGEWERARRYNRCLSLALLDIDDLSTYEEEAGTQQKELVLNEIAQLITDKCRQSDIVARYTGDELAIILPETDASGGFVAAERVREALAQYHFEQQKGEKEVRFTASLGLVNYPLNTADLDGLTREAESALYKAKATGRNRVCGPELPA